MLPFILINDRIRAIQTTQPTAIFKYEYEKNQTEMMRLGAKHIRISLVMPSAIISPGKIFMLPEVP